MKGRSPYDYVKTVYLSDLFKSVIRRLPVLILIMAIAFLATFVPRYLSGQKAKAEAPCYSYSININIDSDFDTNSILNCASVAFSDENLDRLIQYEKLDTDVESVRNSFIYNSEGKGILKLTVYTKDTETAKRFMDGVKYICVPVLAEEADARDWHYSFITAPQEVKIDIFVNDGVPGLADIKGSHIQTWESYLAEKAGIAHLAKNALVLTVCIGLLASVIIMLLRIMSRKLVSVADIEAAAGMPVSAVICSDGSGVEFLAEMIRRNAGGRNRFDLIQVKESAQDAGKESIRTELSKLSDLEVKITKPLSDDPSAAFGEDPAMLFIEDERLTDIELINSAELLRSAGRDIKGVAVYGVDGKKLRRGKDYFGKYYRDKGQTE